MAEPLHEHVTSPESDTVDRQPVATSETQMSWRTWKEALFSISRGKLPIVRSPVPTGGTEGVQQTNEVELQHRIQDTCPTQGLAMELQNENWGGRLAQGCDIIEHHRQTWLDAPNTSMQVACYQVEKRELSTTTSPHHHHHRLYSSYPLYLESPRSLFPTVSNSKVTVSETATDAAKLQSNNNRISGGGGGLRSESCNDRSTPRTGSTIEVSSVLLTTDEHTHLLPETNDSNNRLPRGHHPPHISSTCVLPSSSIDPTVHVVPRLAPPPQTIGARSLQVDPLYQPVWTAWIKSASSHTVEGLTPTKDHRDDLDTTT